MSTVEDTFKFDPSYGYTPEELLQVGAPEGPGDFDSFWQKRYKRALVVSPRPRIKDTGETINGARIFKITHRSTEAAVIGGWLTLPENGVINRGFVVGHGYGGREGPDLHLPFKDAAILFPCARGISRSPYPNVSPDPGWHVIHDLADPNRYIIGHCVEDIWLAASTLIRLFPQVQGHLGYLGISFGGGIGAMAMAFDDRYQKAHFNVPTFGNQPLRLELPTTGSGAAVQVFHKRYPEQTQNTLKYYDAAISASRMKIPTHYACALYDPMVAPPGQFAIYNQTQSPKQLYTLTAGHYEYEDQAKEDAELLSELDVFFSDL
ncbi:acetylxylan esterase [Puniceicoccaceae bacterium K14]|nr:acetylxylan esterase [Puniceicoccaceae bacterium K14]